MTDEESQPDGDDEQHASPILRRCLQEAGFLLSILALTNLAVFALLGNSPPAEKWLPPAVLFVVGLAIYYNLQPSR
jgi:hypothetical protein